MRLRRGRRRYRVALRPKVRGQRTRQAAAVMALIFLGAAASVTARHVQLEARPIDWLRGGLAPRVRAVRVRGLPEGLASRIAREFAQAAPAPPAQGLAAVLQSRYSFIQSAACGRSWSGREAICDVVARRAVASLPGRGRGAMADDGALFAVPEGLALPEAVVEPGASSDDDRRGLAAFLARSAAALPSPVERARFSAQDGWQIRLVDGTTVVWGDWRWTDEKVRRLKEALADARRQAPVGPLTADLRYFEDGRILLRPFRVR